jgi:hypothetical protein
MREFAHSVGEFSSWKGDEQRRRRFLARLISVIRARVRHSFASAVVMDDYRTVDLRYRLSDFSKPYALAGGTCLRNLADWTKRWLKTGDQIQIVFEDGDQDKGDLMRIAKKHFGLSSDSGFGFLPKERSVAFQAADILAYEHLAANVRLKKFGELVFEDLRFSPEGA